jgi:hypothetical protein
LVGAPNDAPSLCSVAGLLLALVLKSRYEDPLPPSLSGIWNDIDYGAIPQLGRATLAERTKIALGARRPALVCGRPR